MVNGGNPDPIAPTPDATVVLDTEVAELWGVPAT